jgi:hypothetical protein
MESSGRGKKVQYSKTTVPSNEYLGLVKKYRRKKESRHPTLCLCARVLIISLLVDPPPFLFRTSPPAGRTAGAGGRVAPKEEGCHGVAGDAKRLGASAGAQTPNSKTELYLITLDGFGYFRRQMCGGPIHPKVLNYD